MWGKCVTVCKSGQQIDNTSKMCKKCALIAKKYLSKLLHLKNVIKIRIVYVIFLPTNAGYNRLDHVTKDYCRLR